MSTYKHILSALSANLSRFFKKEEKNLKNLNFESILEYQQFLLFARE